MSFIYFKTGSADNTLIFVNNLHKGDICPVSDLPLRLDEDSLYWA